MYCRRWMELLLYLIAFLWTVLEASLNSWCINPAVLWIRQSSRI